MGTLSIYVSFCKTIAPIYVSRFLCCVFDICYETQQAVVTPFIYSWCKSVCSLFFAKLFGSPKWSRWRLWRWSLIRGCEIKLILEQMYVARIFCKKWPKFFITEMKTEKIWGAQPLITICKTAHQDSQNQTTTSFGGFFTLFRSFL